MLNRFVLEPEVAKPLIEKYAYLMRDKVGKILVPDPEQLSYRSQITMSKDGYIESSHKYVAKLALVPECPEAESLIVRKLIVMIIVNQDNKPEYFIDDFDLNYTRW